MRRITAGVLLALLVAQAHAGDEGLIGNWKVTILDEGQPLSLWLMKFEAKGGKLAATAEGMRRVPAPAVQELRLDGDRLYFTIEFFVDNRGQKVRQLLPFECVLPKAGVKKMQGSVPWGGGIAPVLLEHTTAKSGFEAEKELVTRAPNDPRVFATVIELIRQAKENKATLKDVQEWAETSLRAADKYGPRFSREVALGLTDFLLEQPDYAAVAVVAACAAEKIPGSAEDQLRTLPLLAQALHKAGKADEAAQVDARVGKLEVQAHDEYLQKSLPFAPEKFTGRKAASKRAVLVELFTGAQCPPCVGADLAFDALARTYAVTDVVLLQYHVHIPAPDALCNAEVEGRLKYYGKIVEGTPTILFGGEPGRAAGGSRDGAKDIYQAYRKAIELQLEKPTAANVKVHAIRSGDKINITASVTRLEKPGENMRLRLALVDEWVRYKGRNGVAFHHHVVRAFPGGVNGITLPRRDSDHIATVDLTELRKNLEKYLDEFARNEEPFLDPQRPLTLRNLRVVAFVQDDANRQVVQAAETAVSKE